MKIGRILYILLFCIVFSGFSSCGSTKEVAQRRNLMMPEKSDLPRNSKFSPTKKKKTYKPKKKKKKSRKLY